MNKANVFNELEFNAAKPLIKVLFETEFTKEIRISMAESTVMKEHKTSFPIVVHVLEGKIDFGLNGEIMPLSSGDLIALDGNIPHDLKAVEKSIIRLTLSKGDSSERVNKVLEEI